MFKNMFSRFIFNNLRKIRGVQGEICVGQMIEQSWKVGRAKLNLTDIKILFCISRITEFDKEKHG